jgi:hypothetical protein
VKIHLAHWTLKTAYSQKSRIDPRPQFQRGEVWNDRRKQLLIDSVLRGYDIPKVYLSKISGNPLHDYEVCDGQQRLTTFWEYFEDGFPLGDNSCNIRGKDLSGKRFSQLSPSFKLALERFKLVIAVLVNPSSDEKRELFARLQMGVVLTPPELRNAIASAIGSFINTVVLTHDFFIQSHISDSRFRKQDYFAHALTLAVYGNKEDLKASLITKLYESYPTNYDNVIANKSMVVLDWLHKINLSASKSIRTKWGFVDLFWLLWLQADSVSEIDTAAFGLAFLNFENDRQLHNSEPESLLTKTPKNKQLYAYIQSFNASGALVDRINKRHAVIKKHFGKYLKHEGIK